MAERADPDQSYLRARLALIEDRVRDLAATRQADDPAPEDPFRGLYVTPEMVNGLLQAGPGAANAVPVTERDELARARVEEQGDQTELHGPLRLRRLARVAGLDDLDIELLLVTLLPDVDSRFERLYGYLNDDVTRRRATVALALELAGIAPFSAEARRRLGPAGPLATADLLVVESEDRPFLTRALRVPDRVASHLLGEDAPDPDLLPCLGPVEPYATALSARLVRALGEGIDLFHLREAIGGMGASVAAAAAARLDLGVVSLEASRLAEQPDPAATLRAARREALLTSSVLLAGPVEVLAAVAPAALRTICETRASRGTGVPVLLTGKASWDPHWTSAAPMAVEVPALEPEERARLWAERLGTDPAELGVGEQLALAPAHVARAVAAARTLATSLDAPLSAEHLRLGIRAQNAAGLERLARRIEPEVGWDDLVVAPLVESSLREITARARHRQTVLTSWRMRRGGGRGIGISALFAGDSGTGKTMAAEVIAADLGLDLYTINLATVVDKYVGETEKNLERIFTEAAGVNAVLFFDEADAVFGKRSSVKDAHDRYANIESAYLLQRLESFDGLAVLATNLRANIDEAFTRRLDAIVDFPAPTPAQRRELWEHCLAPPLPVAEDLDLDFCANSFELAGGNIRSACTTAAYLAADAGQAVGMAEIVAALQQEYRKLGRLVVEREFGAYLSLLE